jgi:hypothetical protein
MEEFLFFNRPYSPKRKKRRKKRADLAEIDVTNRGNPCECGDDWKVLLCWG